MGGVRVVLCAVAVLSAAVVGVKAQEKSPATIAGKVTAEGRPLANVRVELLPQGGMVRKASNEAVTGSDGRFRLTEVKPGRYLISVAAPVFVLENEAAPFSPGKQVIVAAGETVDDVDLVLTRGGTITGRVTNADGEPLIDESLNLFRLDEKGKREPAFPTASLFFFMRTDDRGRYRVFGLRPGRYLVAVGRERRPGNSDYGESRRYPLTFHPGAVEETEAKAVAVASGEVVEDVDITVGAPVKVFTITGRVVDGTGAPVVNVMYGLAGVGEKDTVMSSSFRGDVTNAKGEIRFIGVPAGRYKVSVQTGMIAGETGQETYVEAPTFEVKDADVSGVEVKLLRGQTVSGTVVFEGGFPKKAGTRYLVKAKGDDLSAYTGPAPVNPDGTFTVKGVSPGKVKLYLIEEQQEGPAIMGGIVSQARVEHNGANAAEGIEVARGANVSNVRIIVAFGTGIVRGQVKITGVDPSPPARVLVRLRRLDTPPSEPEQKRQAAVDARNRFLIENLVPGTYEISVAVEGDPTVKGKSEPQTVTVANGRETEAALTLDVTNLQKEGNQ